MQMAAAYMLGLSYNARLHGRTSSGYSAGWKGCVHSQAGAAVKSVNVTGLPETAMTEVMQDAPKTGDVYSAARVNDWLIDAKKRLQVRGQNLKVRQEGHLDQRSASVTVMIAFQE